MRGVAASWPDTGSREDVWVRRVHHACRCLPTRGHLSLFRILQVQFGSLESETSPSILSGLTLLYIAESEKFRQEE